MKVNGDRADQLSGAQAARPQETQAAHKDGYGRDQKPGGVGEDQIDISTLALRIDQARHQYSAEQAHRVDALARLHEQGRLEVNPLDLSQRLIEVSLGVARATREEG